MFMNAATVSTSVSTKMSYLIRGVVVVVVVSSSKKDCTSRVDGS